MTATAEKVPIQDEVRTAVALLSRSVLMPDVPREEVLGDEDPDGVLKVMEMLAHALFTGAFQGREPQMLAKLGAIANGEAAT
ncbi:MAG TPA: hypothetical protein VGG75_15975 [Trebonia sp.]|jgi:hypothetical protein